MIKTTEYNKKSTKIAYHRASGKIVPIDEACAGTVVFDSMFEYNVFKRLEAVSGYSISIHNYVKHIKWYIDFTLKLKKANDIPKALQGLNLRPHKGVYIYVDAKGVIDNATYQRIKKMPYNAQRSILLVCNNTRLKNIEAAPIIRTNRLALSQKKNK